MSVYDCATRSCDIAAAMYMAHYSSAPAIPPLPDSKTGLPARPRCYFAVTSEAVAYVWHKSFEKDRESYLRHNYEMAIEHGRILADPNPYWASKGNCCQYALNPMCVCTHHHVCHIHGSVHRGSHD